MKVKVCGMKHPENIKALAELDIDYMGFIFYQKSPRYAQNPVEIPNHIQKVGVFVNATVAEILNKVKGFQLNVIQLHGHETAEFCEELNQNLVKEGKSEVKLWKVFSIKTQADFEAIDSYSTYVDAFLLDTKGEYRGGNGEKFDWQLLQQQKFSKPVMLSGGIGPNDAEELISLHKKELIHGIDVNSGFEDQPGLKNIDLIKEFLQNLRTYEQV
jgi:phosphoribosylanthranilate isomerase